MTENPTCSAGVKVLEEDQLLIARFVHSNDHGAFVNLIQRHLSTIRRLLFTLFRGNRMDMEDAEQEVLLGLFQNLSLPIHPEQGHRFDKEEATGEKDRTSSRHPA